MADEALPLEIEFLDPVDDVEVGHSYRFQVVQRNHRGEKQQMTLDHLDFEFKPIVWGKVVHSSDPGVGTIQVVEIVDPEDVFLAPHYSVSATLRPHAVRVLAPKKKIRMSAVAMEIELGFATGLEGKWKAFEPLKLPRPVDLGTAKLSSAHSKILVRDGKVFLRIDGLDNLPSDIALTFPNGETAALRIEGNLRGMPVEPDARTRTPIGQHTEAPEDPETAACRAELAELRTYVGSFGGRKRPDDATVEGIRRRIAARVQKTKERLVLYTGPKQEELLQLFKAATDQIPSYLREGAPLEAAPPAES
ncbi:MAG TPA: hypothetical protein VFF73_36700 [Planctomycetota bacterium]|nr:hypothetical protein [Planctomycetota bacterium]